MTICIAASCVTGNGERKLILCTDTQGSSLLGKKALVWKNFPVAKAWRCLTAGGDDDLNTLIPILRKQFRSMQSIDETNILPNLQDALMKLKLFKCDEFTKGRYGISYADFLRDGKNQFPDDRYRADVNTISHLEPNVECIVAGFTDDSFPILCKLEPGGRVAIFDDFAVAGEGGYLAQAAMIHRQLSDVSFLEDAIYCVYEAKKYAERVASVSDDEIMHVMSHDGTFEQLTRAGKKYLNLLYQKSGPQPTPQGIVIDSQHLKPFAPNVSSPA